MIRFITDHTTQEGLNRRSTHNLMHIYRKDCRGNTGQLDEDSTVKDTGQLIGRGDTSLVSKKEKSRLPSTGPSVSMAPFYKTQSTCYRETLTDNAKQELVVYRVLRPYITTSLPRGIVCNSHC